MNHKSKYIFSLNDFIIYFLLIFFAFSLQIFKNINIFGSEIRVSISDFILPVIVLVFIRFMCNKEYKSIIVSFYRIKNILLILSLYLFFQLLNGYFYSNNFSEWAFFNKFIGWFVLLMYFFWGVFFASQKRNLEIIFLKFLVIFCLIIGLYDCFDYLGYYFGFFKNDYQRMQGFAQNPNAFGILTSVIFILYLTFSSQKEIFSKNKDFIFLVSILTFSLLSGSKSVILGYIFVLFFLIFVRLVSLKKLIKILLFSILIFYTISNGLKIRYYIETTYQKLIAEDILYYDFKQYEQKNWVPNYLEALTQNKGLDQGTNHRIESAYRATLLWKENPIFGIGLGSYLEEVSKTSEKLTIHNSALWILTEMGLVGLFLFLGFFIYCIYLLLKKRFENSAEMSNGSILILVFFIGASLGTEIIYQRYIWFIVGWGLANAINNKKKIV